MNLHHWLSGYWFKKRNTSLVTHFFELLTGFVKETFTSNLVVSNSTLHYYCLHALERLVLIIFLGHFDKYSWFLLLLFFYWLCCEGIAGTLASPQAVFLFIYYKLNKMVIVVVYYYIYSLAGWEQRGKKKDNNYILTRMEVWTLSRCRCRHQPKDRSGRTPGLTYL